MSSEGSSVGLDNYDEEALASKLASKRRAADLDLVKLLLGYGAYTYPGLDVYLP